MDRYTLKDDGKSDPIIYRDGRPICVLVMNFIERLGYGTKSALLPEEYKAFAILMVDALNQKLP